MVSASIIIDNYNYAGFIRETIDSALNQTYPVVEVIVVDDGSTDESREIILSYSNTIIPVFKNNGGQASAFNAGFEKSKGEVIFFLDSDDTLLPDAVKNAMFFFISPDISKVQWPLWIIDENGRKTGNTRPSQLPPEGNFKDAVLQGGPTSCISSPTSGNAWARNFLEKIFPIPEDVLYYKTCADEYMYTLAPVFGSVKTIKQPQGFYRIHGRNIYSALPFEKKLEMELVGHGQQTTALSFILRKYGFSVDEKLWRSNSWFHLLKAAIDDINTLIPPQATFILVDDESWNITEIFPERKVLPFLECDGLYGGYPETDEIAIEELNRLKNAGANYIVFAKQSFWWFNYLRKFYNYLCTHFILVLENERILIFDLKLSDNGALSKHNH